MPHRAFIAAVALATFAPPAAAQESADSRGEAFRGDDRCGEYCLRVALPGLGFDGDAAAAALEALGPAPPGGHALADLADAVEAAGGHWLAVDTAPDRLRTRRELGERFACVAHVDGNHFLLVSEVAENGEARVIDPPASYPLPPETLAKRWGGTALLISRTPLTPEGELPGPFPWLIALLVAAGACAAAGVWLWRREPAAKRRFAGPVSAAAVLATAAAGCGGEAADADTDLATAAPPRAAYETLERDAGVIPVSPDGHVVAFPVTHRGGSPLRFLSVTTSCDCTDAAVPPEPLLPGETGEVRLAIAPKLPQKKSASATVVTDDPVDPRATLSIRWRSVAPWTPEPAELDFGSLRPGETAEGTVRLVRHAVAGVGGGRPTDVTARSDALAADWLTPPADAGAGSEGDGADGGGPPVVRVRLTAGRELKAGGGAVSVALADAWVDRLVVPVRWTVQDVVAAEPPRAFLGSGPPGADRKTRVVLIGDGPLTVVEGSVAINGEAFAGVAASVTPLGRDRAVVDLAGPLPAAAGIHRGELTAEVDVETDAGTRRRTLTVPLSALVAEPEPPAAGDAP